MRTWGRVPVTSQNPSGWVEVSTDPTTGLNDLVWITTLCQTLLLNLGESPFYANLGIPAAQAVAQQVAPDYYVALTQQNFSSYFASLIVSREANNVTPTYNITAITNQGYPLNASTQIAQ